MVHATHPRRRVHVAFVEVRDETTRRIGAMAGVAPLRSGSAGTMTLEALLHQRQLLSRCERVGTNIDVALLTTRSSLHVIAM